MIIGVMVLLTRMERSRNNRRNKKRFRLLIFFVIILIFISINHINNTYNSLVGGNGVKKIFAMEINSNTNNIGIVFFGEEINLSGDFIIELKDYAGDTWKTLYHWFNEKIGNLRK